MVNKYFWMPVIAAAAVLAGCAKQEPSPNEKEALQSPGEENVELEEVTINVQAPDARTYLSGGKVCWNSGDKITIFDSTDRNATSKAGAAASGESASFTAEITKGSTPVYALYPNDAAATLSGGLITTTLSDSQSPSNTGSFGRCNVAVGALADDGAGGYDCELKNVCGYIKFTLPKHCTKTRKDNGNTFSSTHVSKVTFTSPENLVGKITINYNSGSPVITKVESALKTVVVNVKHYTASDDKDGYCSGDYYAVVLPGTYTGLTVTLTYDDTTPNYTRTTTGSFTVRRGQYTDIGILADEVVIMNYAGENNQLYQGTGGEKTYLPTSGRKTNGVEEVWKLDYNDKTYEFGITNWTGAVFEDKTYNGSYMYYASTQSLYLNTNASLLRLPAISGLALGYIRGLHGNSASKTDVKKINICSDAGDIANGTDPTNLKQLQFIYWNPEERGGVDQTKWYSAIPEGDRVKNKSYFLQPRTGTSNICIRRLELYYYKQD